MKRMIYILISLVACTSIWAQSPDAFNYQAVVRDQTGAVLPDTKVTMQISILQGNTTGSVVYSETFEPVTNAYGLVSLNIGSGSVISGSFSGINWSNGPYYIKILVNGSELSLTQLLSVPYAKYADKAGNVFSGNYNNLTNKPVLFDGTWASLTGKPNFAAVATSGDYNDLRDLPRIYSGQWDSISGKPDFAPVAFSGKYSDLTGLPTLFSGSYNDLTNKPVLFDGTWASLSGKPTFATVATSGSYNDLSNKPVLFSGSYNDLTNKPVLFDGSWASLIGKPTFAAVSYSGSYKDLVDTPTLFSGNYNDLTNKPALFDGTWNSLTGKPSLATVATSGDYNDLINKPALFSGSYNDLTNKPVLFSGSYNDLTNKPVLVNWTWDLITGKPTFAAVATSGSYNDLSNKPVLFDGKWSSLTATPTTLAGYGITDAMSTSHAANAITSTEISNWKTAYGWGNPASKGYALAADYYTKKELQTSDSAQVHWDNITNKPTTLAGYGITDFAVTSPSNNQLLQYNGTTKQWENWTPSFPTGNQTLSLKGDTLTISGTAGNSVIFTNWDTNGNDNVLLSGNQTITGNKTFMGTLQTNSILEASGGLDAGNNTLTNVADPTASSDAATKNYVDALNTKITDLQTKINAIYTKLGL